MFTRLVIISNFHYNDLINKLQQNPKYTVPQNELGVIYSPNNIEVLKKIIQASLVSNIQSYYNTVQSKGQLIHNKSFTSNKYKDIIQRICEYLQLHCYDIAISGLKLLSEIVTVPIEKIIQRFPVLHHFQKFGFQRGKRPVGISFPRRGQHGRQKGGSRLFPLALRVDRVQRTSRLHIAFSAVRRRIAVQGNRFVSEHKNFLI